MPRLLVCHANLVRFHQLTVTSTGSVTRLDSLPREVQARSEHPTRHNNTAAQIEMLIATDSVPNAGDARARLCTCETIINRPLIVIETIKIMHR